MDYSAKARLMIALYENNRMEEAREEMVGLVGACVKHQGRGDLHSYFYPIMYLDSFARIAIEAGHDLFEVQRRSSWAQECYWINLPSVVDWICQHQPSWLVGLLDTSMSSEWMEGPNLDDRNWDISMEYLGGLDTIVQDMAEHWSVVDSDVYGEKLVAFVQRVVSNGVRVQHGNALVECMRDVELREDHIQKVQDLIAGAKVNVEPHL